MRAEVEEGVHKLETLLSTNVDRNFDKFEIFALRNIFAVDEDLVPWIRLGHYQVCRRLLLIACRAQSSVRYRVY